MVRGGLQEWWWRAIEVPPWQPSLVTAACALAVHPWSGHSLNRPISLELHALNPFAVLTVFGVGWIVFLMTRCFWIRQYFFSAVTGMLCLLCVGLIVAVDPFAVVHNAAFALLVLLANALLFVWAVDTLNIVLVLPALIPLLVGPFAYFTLGFGGFQLILIGALLLALNLTVRHIVQRELRSWDEIRRKRVTRPQAPNRASFRPRYRPKASTNRLRFRASIGIESTCTWPFGFCDPNS